MERLKTWAFGPESLSQNDDMKFGYEWVSTLDRNAETRSSNTDKSLHNQARFQIICNELLTTCAPVNPFPPRMPSNSPHSNNFQPTHICIELNPKSAQ
jgi:hypothetical protein